MSAKNILAVLNVYRPPSQDVFLSDLEQSAQQRQAPFVLIGGFNVTSPTPTPPPPSPRWGELRRDSRGSNVKNNIK